MLQEDTSKFGDLQSVGIEIGLKICFRIHSAAVALAGDVDT
jgi:hypothetical protein